MILLQLVSDQHHLKQHVNSENITGGGVDYDSGPYTVIFPAGMISVTFNVSITNDNVLERTEAFQLVITPSSLQSRVSQAAPNQTVISVIDDDSECSVCCTCVVWTGLSDLIYRNTTCCIIHF